MSAIRTENLQKHYGAVKALDGLNLDVAEGTIFGFLGPNGAGKSTTVRLLTGLAEPTAGRGWVAGVDIRAGHAAARKLGYLPEEPAFYNWMTPAEYLDHVGRIFGLPAAERAARTRGLLEQVGLAEVSQRRIAGFSRGMRQRLGLAQALVNRPEVLLLDEPASALDPAGRRDVLEMIQALRGQCTVFMSTHILADVERVCDTVGILNHGQMIVEARQEELLARYTLPAFELEGEPAEREAFSAWLGEIERLPWVTTVQANGGAARVVVRDMAPARHGLLAAAANSGLALRRFEVVTASLEDVFLQLVDRSNHGKAGRS
jgi:ABC-2 type transport system ATP-binding protein